MKIEDKLKEELWEYGDSLECPVHMYSQIKRNYNNTIGKKEKQNKMRKFIATKTGIAACCTIAVLTISISAYAAPKIIEVIRSQTFQEENVSLEVKELKPVTENFDSIQQIALNKINEAFLETKEFEITSVETGKGYVDDEQMNWTCITLNEKGSGHKEFSFTFDSTTGTFIDFSKKNWDLDYSALAEDELIEIIKIDIESIFGTLAGFESGVVADEGVEEKLQYMENTESYYALNRKIIEFTHPESNVYYQIYAENNNLNVSALLKTLN